MPTNGAIIRNNELTKESAKKQLLMNASAYIANFIKSSARMPELKENTITAVKYSLLAIATQYNTSEAEKALIDARKFLISNHEAHYEEILEVHFAKWLDTFISEKGIDTSIVLEAHYEEILEVFHFAK